MTEIKFIPIILAGGKGERFWPLSRLNRPKQFLSLDGSGNTLLQNTAQRLLSLAGGWEGLMVITSEVLAEGVRQQLPHLPQDNILVEPMGKDTAPAVAWASLEVKRRYGDEPNLIVGFFPADHHIGNTAEFARILHRAIHFAAEKQGIITLGIQPNHPATGYGYIEQGELQCQEDDIILYKVARFTEKPNQDTAKQFIATGRYSWNSGMFIFPVAVVLAELEKHSPDILLPLLEGGKSAYPQLPKISIDYALMEKTSLAYVIPANFGWDDLGDWNALERLLQKQDGNVVVGNCLVTNTENCILYNHQPEEIVVAIGVRDLVVVRVENATLIVPKSETQNIKKALQLLQQGGNSHLFL
ncbi:MAG: mannose-1-phosphate guanylyltransferase [Geminocystis sp.]|nr:sugar phosphate nucleotidyltransferase [Geminocystis sp.]MDW8462745.1 mannose-1-phosphate guanylyltransferase [Geminocystis sp.]